MDKGLVKAIGLSNFNSAQVAEIVAAARIQPACLQVESHPFFANEQLRAFCAERKIVMSAYSPLGSGATIDGHTVPTHPVLAEIGQKYGATAAQMAIAFQAHRGVPTFPKSVTAERIRANLKGGQIKLEQADFDKIAALDAGVRVGWGGPKVERDGKMVPRDLLHPNYPFRDGQAF